ncbi:afadin-like isoform X4 [Ostrea edulis]|uniref:afadin-like isoform X4 n=1 Tax=Ostrea edulis TaxID=37623 RepID=UPI0024AEEC33|nr:afadin-like isoform X4 [Ostrea edulis]
MTDKIQERQRLANIITQWNQDHYDLFELSQPNEECEFHGVVRFYFQDGANVVTKCIRVASSATTREVVDVLVEKFRPDMRMLTSNKYALHEVHANGEERRLENLERVLWVQLNWGTEVREGRFLLKREGDRTVPHTIDKENQGGTFKRKLSKREKKEQRKKEKEKKINESGNAAEQLYTDMPETRFTRSISNPEAVMKRRRQQKVEKKLQQCRGQDGQGGTLKIYGESIKPDVPYKTLLLSTADNVRYVVKETMDKYGMDFTVNDPEEFCLVQVLVPPGEREYHGGNIGEERIMEDHECPLAIAMDFPPTKGTMMFHFRRRSNDAKKTKHKKLRAVSHEELRSKVDEAPPQKLPYLVELNPDGSDNPKGKVYRLNMKFTEVGSDPSMFIKVQGPNIQPRHCVLGLVEKDGVVTVTPTSPESETHVNNQRISETTTLQNGMTVRFGKLHVYRFIDPNFEEKLRKGQIPPDGAIQKQRIPPHQKPMETSFDSPGPTPSPRDPRQQEPMETQRRSVPQPMGSPRREENSYPPHRQGSDALPAVLEFREDKEEHFFANIILDSATAGIQFKLAPTYTIYLAVRFSLSNGYRSDLSPQDKAIKITDLVIKIANFTHQAIHSHRDNPAALAFWMANSSEILHFFKQDHDIHPFSQDAQEMLAESVQMAFHHLNRCLQYDLQRTLPAFLDDGDDDDSSDKNKMQYNRGRPSLGDVLDTLTSAMNLLRRCRVNAALTIQLFSQLFHFINMWLFNILVKEQHQFCMRVWGVRLKRRLSSVEAWAEKQGLELAADCHLCRIIQAAHLLQAPKNSPDCIADISSTCFKLNSLQLRELLQRYIPEPGEPPVPHSLIEGVVKIAENMADELIKNDGRQVCLEEDGDLQLPFLLPEDGYTCDSIKGIPKGIDEFIEPLAKAGLCRVIPQPGASGDWTVYMSGDDGPKIDEAVRKGPQQHPQPPSHHGDRQQQLPKEPEIATVTFSKVKGSMGLSIVEATPKSEGQKVSGIYIKSVVPGGAAALDGRLQAGDQLLEVDGKGLVGLSQDKAAELMTRTGQTVTLKVVKQGAFYHGLATLLSQPSPVLPRASPKKPSSPQSSKHRPSEEGPPPYNAGPDMDRTRPFQPGMDPRQKQAMQSPHNRSSPALNSDSSMMPGGRTLREQPQHSPHRPPHHRDPRVEDAKSKSMANLHMDNSFDHRDPPHHQHNMRPAASVGALQNANVPFQDYYNQGRNDPRGNDYENHPSVDPRIPRHQQDPMRNHGYTDVNHNVPPGHLVKPQLRENVEQGSPSSRHSGSSGREERPQSAYYPHQVQPDFGREERPKSMEVNLGKIQEMQQRYGHPQHSPHQSPHERSFDNERDPNYINMRAQQQQMQSGYVNQSDIPRYTASNESRQLNFYENTSPRQNEASPAFHQLKPAELDGKKPPPTMPKPSVAPKPNAPKVTPADIPRVDIDNRQTQSHFFEPKIQQQLEQRSPKVPSSQVSYTQGRGMPPHSAGYQHDPRTNSLPRGKFTPPRDSSYPQQTHQSPELPPPPQEIPPELPPPPAPEDLPEVLPPLPPPPANEYSLDPQYANSADPRFGPPGGFQHQGRFGHPQQRVQPQQQRNMGFVEPQQQHPPHSATLPNRFQQPSNDYQNILYEKQNRPFDSSMQHPANQNLYESYDPKSRSLPPMKMDPQLSKHRLMTEVNEVALRAQKDGGPLASPWDREEQEKLNKMREEEMSRLREMEINELESRSYLSPQEQDRLKKLRLEQEFQRRVQECASRDDDDEDSDTEISSRTQGREYLIQTIQDDIVKAHRKLEELNQKHLYEEYEREKDRMQRLERKLEMFEMEREERQQRLQKRQEKKLREQEEYQRKQRDLREKQRQDYEEQKRIMKLEEEKLMKKKQEEEQRRKEMERERLRELEAQREQEEARLRAEARQRQEEHQRREVEARERERREQEKRDQELRVREEAQRLEALRLQSQPPGYNQQYANLPAHTQYGVPAPPMRGSSYDVHVMNRQNDRNPEMQNGFRNMNNNNPNYRNMPETVAKKSVSFNTQLETRNTYSVGSESDRTPYASQSSYRSSTSDQNDPHSPYGQPSTPDHAPDNVFDHSNTPQQNHVSYKTTEITPTVVGSQEVYRDPRSRIMAQKEAQGGNAFTKKSTSDRMSFRDKMKFFAQEAGENTPKEKPKASKTLRNIESQLHNGK